LTVNVFVKTVSESVAGLEYSKIIITKVQDIITAPKLLQQQFSREMSSTTTSTGIYYIISITAQSLGYTNATAANNYITSKLSVSVKTGKFTSLLQLNAIIFNQPVLKNVTATEVIFTKPLSTPTNQPITPETPKNINSNNQSGYSSWPLYGQVLLPIAIVIVFCAFALLFLQFYSLSLPFGKKSKSKNEATTITPVEASRTNENNNFSDINPNNKTEVVVGEKVTDNPISYTPNNA
jgi:hypothetical protein